MIAGISEQNDYLEYYFPRKKKTPYIGAAHGTIGVVYMLIKALQIAPSLQKDSDFVGIIKNTVHYISSLQTTFGSFPYKSGEALPEEREPNHWCHGAPGAIPLLVEAYLTFKDQHFLDLALKSGKCVWKNGLLKKGIGLCHGISGNAYFLMSLYKATGDIEWK